MCNLNEFLLKELKISTGCNEPAAITFASSFAKEKFGSDEI